MSLDLAIYDGNDLEQACIINFTNDGFQELVTLGLGQVPHCTANDGNRVIDLQIFRPKVVSILEQRKIPNNQTREMLRAIEQYRYLAINP
jgi:hypothetical protein